MLKQGLEDEIKVAKKQLGESQLTRSTTEEELHGAEAALSETKKTLATDTKYLEELHQSCETKVAQRMCVFSLLSDEMESQLENMHHWHY